LASRDGRAPVPTQRRPIERRQTVAMTPLSCHRFRANEVRPSLIAYNLGNLWRRLALPARIRKWSLTSTRLKRCKESKVELYNGLELESQKRNSG
jgi:hypothetical protein